MFLVILGTGLGSPPRSKSPKTPSQTQKHEKSFKTFCFFEKVFQKKIYNFFLKSEFSVDFTPEIPVSMRVPDLMPDIYDFKNFHFCPSPYCRISSISAADPPPK